MQVQTIHGEQDFQYDSDLPFQKSQEEEVDLNFDSFLDDQDKVGAELNNSVFTFAQQHNSMVEEPSQIMQAGNQISSPQKSVLPQKILSDAKFNQQVYETCQNCSRQFFQGRLYLHQKSCKPQNPLKPLNILKINNIVSSIDPQHVKLTQIYGRKKKQDAGESLLSHRISATPTTAGSIEQQQKSVIKSSELQSSSSIKSTSLSLPKWKLEHQSILLSKRSPQLKTQDLIYQQYIECQYCLRKFKPQVATQHIPNCKNIFNRPKPPKKMLLQEMNDKCTTEQIVPGITTRTSRVTQSEKLILFEDNFTDIKGNKLTDYQSQLLENSITVIKDIDIQNRDRSGSMSCHEQNRLINQIGKGRSQNNLSLLNSNSEILFKIPVQKSIRRLYQQSPSTQKPLTKTESVDHIQTINNKGEQNFDIDLFGCDHLEQDISNKKTLNQSTSIQHLPSIFEKKQQQKIQQLSEIKESVGVLNYEDVVNRSKNYSQIACPYCDRKFSKHAAPRHIPICKNIQNKPLRQLKKNDQTQFSASVKSNIVFHKNNLQNIENEQKEQYSMSTKQTQQIENKKGSMITCFCTNCGSQLFFSFKYCSSCGKKR